jgi:hypothetical protein
MQDNIEDHTKKKENDNEMDTSEEHIENQNSREDAEQRKARDKFEK